MVSLRLLGQSVPFSMVGTACLLFVPSGTFPYAALGPLHEALPVVSLAGVLHGFGCDCCSVGSRRYGVACVARACVAAHCGLALEPKKATESAEV